ncbi:methyltransferase family protein [Streptomyces sp. 4N124]|uniref:methyltransferase family protein n=1 Tax=Streptomyces sp. 4N124 TaxID=3457420 RepID=UPI003FD10995
MTGKSAARLVRTYTLILFLLQLGVFALAMTTQLRRSGEPQHQVAAAMLVAYLSWGIAELKITASRPGEGVAESRTLAVYATVRCVTWASAALGPLPWTHWSAWMLVPIALFTTGVTLRLVAIRVLGRFYSHHVRRLTDHQIITTGPYRLVRHPAYTGMALANAGFVALFFNPLSLIAWLCLILVLLWRIHTEEQLLQGVPGYSAYAAGRPRLVPGIW